MRSKHRPVLGRPARRPHREALKRWRYDPTIVKNLGLAVRLAFATAELAALIEGGGDAFPNSGRRPKQWRTRDAAYRASMNRLPADAFRRF
jgi:hypothetical protein